MIFNMTGGKKTEDPLNFQVKAYPSETELKADNPSENTIGVITTTTISSWAFSATEPTEPEVGMVWIETGNSSDVAFDALKNKKQELRIYPLSAMQYVNDAWAVIEALSYQNGTWNEWITFLYNQGNEYESVTGGWISAGMKASADGNSKEYTPEIERGDTYIRATIPTSGRSGIFYMQKPIDITGHSTIVFNGEFFNSSQWENLGLALWSRIGSYYPNNIIAEKTVTSGSHKEIMLDLTSIPNGSYFIGFFINTYGNGSSSYVEITKAYLER